MIPNAIKAGIKAMVSGVPVQELEYIRIKNSHEFS